MGSYDRGRYIYEFEVGYSWSGEPIPAGLNMSWMGPSLLVIGSTPRDSQLLKYFEPETPIRLGVSRYQNLVVLLLDLPGFKTLEGIYALQSGESNGEVSLNDDEQFPWTMLLVSEGAISALRQFSTSLAFSRALNKLFSEQRTLGAISLSEIEAQVSAWETKTTQLHAAWGFCTATSWSIS